MSKAITSKAAASAVTASRVAASKATASKKPRRKKKGSRVSHAPQAREVTSGARAQATREAPPASSPARTAPVKAAADEPRSTEPSPPPPAIEDLRVDTEPLLLAARVVRPDLPCPLRAKPFLEMRPAPSTEPEPDERSADEISIPPAGDLTMDRFFAEGESEPLVEASAGEEDEVEEEDPRAAFRQAAVRARRERYSRYVRGLMGVAAVVCVAAGLRAVVSRASIDAGAIALSHVSAAAAPLAQVGVTTTVTEAPIQQVAPQEVTAPAPEPPAAAAEPSNTARVEPAAEPPKADPPKAAEPEKTAEAPSVAAGAVDAKSAKEEKSASRQALERGATALAIAAGERSVAIDPTDGEAWLILGAAYQEKGKAGEARRCFLACVKQGKKGPIGECSAMLQ